MDIYKILEEKGIEFTPERIQQDQNFLTYQTCWTLLRRNDRYFSSTLMDNKKNKIPLYTGVSFEDFRSLSLIDFYILKIAVIFQMSFENLIRVYLNRTYYSDENVKTQIDANLYSFKRGYEYKDFDDFTKKASYLETLMLYNKLELNNKPVYFIPNFLNDLRNACFHATEVFYKPISLVKEHIKEYEEQMNNVLKNDGDMNLELKSHLETNQNSFSSALFLLVYFHDLFLESNDQFKYRRNNIIIEGNRYVDTVIKEANKLLYIDDKADEDLRLLIKLLTSFEIKE